MKILKFLIVAIFILCIIAGYTHHALYADQFNDMLLDIQKQSKQWGSILNEFQECAFIISKMPIDFIARHAVDLMEWFQDLNWPGVDEIFVALSRLPEDKLTAALNKSFETARNTQDEEWDYNLHLKFDKTAN